MADLIRTGSGHGAGMVKDKLGSPSTGSEDGNEQDTQGAAKQEPDEPDLGDSAHYAPSETLWYHGRLDRYQAEERLWQCNKLGSYLVRESDRKPGSYVLSYLGRTGMNHFRITAVCGDFYIGGRQFVSLNDLVGYYTECSDLLKRERLVHPVAPPEPVNDKKVRTKKREINRSDRILCLFSERLFLDFVIVSKCERYTHKRMSRIMSSLTYMS